MKLQVLTMKWMKQKKAKGVGKRNSTKAVSLLHRPSSHLLISIAYTAQCPSLHVSLPSRDFPPPSPRTKNPQVQPFSSVPPSHPEVWIFLPSGRWSNTIFPRKEGRRNMSIESEGRLERVRAARPGVSWLRVKRTGSSGSRERCAPPLTAEMTKRRENSSWNALRSMPCLGKGLAERAPNTRNVRPRCSWRSKDGF